MSHKDCLVWNSTVQCTITQSVQFYDSCQKKPPCKLQTVTTSTTILYHSQGCKCYDLSFQKDNLIQFTVI